VRFGILKKENEKMKKLIMMLAVVCSIGMAQAAFVDWQFGKDTAYNDYTVYAYDSANSATVLAALGAFDADALSTIEGLVLSSKNVSKGNAKSSGVDVGSATSLMLLAINGAFEADKGFSYGTLDITGKTYGGTDISPGYAVLASFSNSGTITAATIPDVPSDPVTPAIPEPTSGLLMLVGLGALALRRKRA
jgi:hypothetical protein